MLSITLFAQSECALKVSANYFINNKHFVTFNDEPAIDINFDNNDFPIVDMDIYDSKGYLQASIRNNKLESGLTSRYPIFISDDEVSVQDQETGKLVFMVRRSTTKSNFACEWNVFANIYVPDGRFVYFTPDESNISIFQNIKGTTFSNSLTAIALGY